MKNGTLTIALFGATGQTGQHVLDQALEAGYKVQVLVRNRDKLKQKSDNLTVVQGDVLNQKDVENTLHGADIVVSVFGHRKDSPEWLQTNGTKHILQAMKKFGIKRIISLSGGGLPYPEKDKPKIADFAIRTIMKMVAPKVLNDAIAHHAVLKESDFDWVIVRAPRLTNGPRTNTYRVGWVGVNASTQLSRADLADFVLQLVEDTQYDRQMPFVSQ